MKLAILSLLAICAATAGAVFGHVVPMTSSVSNLCLVVFALAATLLVGSLDALESQPIRIDRDDR